MPREERVAPVFARSNVEVVMLRHSRPRNVRFVVLSWTSDGGSLGAALPKLGLKSYTLKTMLAQNEHGKVHPQRWDNLLRPKHEHFDAFAAAQELQPPSGVAEVIRSRIVRQDRIAAKMGVATTEKLVVGDLAGYDAIVGLPVTAMDPAQLLDFFPAYTKFILVEETNKPEWAKSHVEDGVVPVLVNLRNVLRRSPTGKVWFSLFRHFAWPRSTQAVLDTIPKQSDERGGGGVGGAAAMIQPSFMKDEGKSNADKVGDICAVQARRDAAESALQQFEHTVKALIPAGRLYVFRDGDGWEPLVHFVGKDQEIVPSLGAFPKASYGKEFLDQVRFRIARTQMVTSLVNIALAVAAVVLLWNVDLSFMPRINALIEDARRATQRQPQQGGDKPAAPSAQ